MPEGKPDPPKLPRVQSGQYRGSFRRAGSSSLLDSNAIADRKYRLDVAHGFRESTLAFLLVEQICVLVALNGVWTTSSHVDHEASECGPDPHCSRLKILALSALLPGAFYQKKLSAWQCAAY